MDRRTVIAAIGLGVVGCSPENILLPAVKLAPIQGLLSAAGWSVPGVSTVSIGSRPMILNFWGTWCPYCRSEHEALIDMSAQSRAQLVGIAVNDTPDKVASYLGAHGNPYAAVSIDHRHELIRPLSQRGVPTKFVIGPDRRVVGKVIGPASDSGVRERINDLVRQVAANKAA